MSKQSRILNAQRKKLGLEVKDVAEAMNRRGFDLAYSTVAGWFNSNRGKRWKVEELRALLDILQLDLDALVGKGMFVEQPLLMEIAAGAQMLTPRQQQAVAMMVRALRQEPKLLPPPDSDN